MTTTIRLWTGYEIPMSDGWEKHLASALLGEVMLGSMKAGIATEWDDAARLLAAECDRISRVYDLNLLALLIRVFARVEQALPGDPAGRDAPTTLKN